MRNLLLMITLPLLWILTSCGPVTYTIPVERRIGVDSDLNFHGTLPGIISIVGRGDSDSTLQSAFSIGIAERLEADLGLDSGAVPIYCMYEDEVHLEDSVFLSYLHAATGVDFLIAVDSMEVGEFTVAFPEEKAYSGGSFLQQSVVSLPYTLKVMVFSNQLPGPVEAWRDSDVLEWTLLSETNLTRLRAVEKVDSELAASFRTVGGSFAERFVPQWETVNMMIYVYDDRNWTEACRLAWLFEWDKAMEIWYDEADSPDIRKAACAAHNLSVACEILGLEESAAIWKSRFEELNERKNK